MNINNSLLSDQQSTWVKGLLILLIVLGHDSVLMGNYEGMHKTVFFHFLYSFHVFAFFFVRSLYDWKPLCYAYAKKSFVKLYKPFTVWFFLLFVMSLLKGHDFVGAKTLLLAYITGSGSLMNKSFATSYLWFLPSMFSFSLLLGLFARRIKCLNIILLIASLLAMIVFSIGGFAFTDVINATPAGSFFAFRIFGLSIICRWLFELFNQNKIYQYIILTSTLITTVLFFLFYKDLSTLSSNVLKFGIMPFLMFQFIGLLLYKLNHFNDIILYFGRHSLEIYLFHLIVYGALVKIVEILDFNPSVLLGLGLYFATLFLTILATFLFSKCMPETYKFLFSKQY